MNQIIFYILIAGLMSVANSAPACENTWTAYKGEVCIKAFTDLETYDDAKAFCASLGDDSSDASLVIIRDAGMQEFLSNFTEGFFDYIWLGGRYDVSSSQFRWEDGSSLNYSNWMEGFPRNNTDDDACIELRPQEEAKSYVRMIHGKWAHETCRKRNLVMCQKSLSWSLQDAVNELIALRRQHDQELREVREELATVNNRVIPVGSIYVEYFSQSSPQTLWPNLTWQDISSTYAGLFFRSAGSGSGGWGVTQEGCSPRITATDFEDSGAPYVRQMNLTSSGWSVFGRSGYYYSGSSGYAYYEGMRFFTEDCEVRPRNQEVRIWKRTA